MALAVLTPERATVGDEELFASACRGDEAAVAALYVRHRDAARHVAGLCTGSPADADDAVSEAFARVFAALPRLAGRSIAFRPYLLTAVRNAATDAYRRSARLALGVALPEARSDSDPEEHALRHAEHHVLEEALSTLPGRWRTVLWLTEVEGLSPFEVSRRIGIKPNAVAALAYRSRQGLRQAYRQAEEQPAAAAGRRAGSRRVAALQPV